MKKINHIIISLLTIISLTACDSKDEYYYTNDKDNNQKPLGERKCIGSPVMG